MNIKRLLYLAFSFARRIIYLIYKPTVLGVRALVIKGDKILLIKHTYQPNWYTPGGGVKNQEYAQDAIIRELEEEVRVKVTGTPRIFNVYYTNIHGRNDYVVFYLCQEFEEGEGHCPEEIQDKKWFSFDELPTDISPATLRRIDEYLGKVAVTGKW